MWTGDYYLIRKDNKPEYTKDRQAFLHRYIPSHEQNCSGTISHLTWISCKKTCPNWNLHKENSYLFTNVVYRSTLLPAVVLPSFLNTGLSFARPDSVVSGRMPSSADIVTCFSSPLFGSIICNKCNPTVKNWKLDF